MRKKTFLECLELAKGHIALYLVGLFGSALGSAAMDLTTALLLHKLLDAIADGDLAVLAMRLVVFGGATLLVAASGALFGYLFKAQAAAIMGSIRKRYFQKALQLPLAQHVARHSGDILSGLSNDINALASFYSGLPQTVVSALLSGAVGMVYLASIDIRLCIYTVIVGLLSVVVNTRFAPFLRRLGHSVQEQLALLTRDYSEILSGMLLIRTLRIFDIFQARFAKHNAALVQQSLRRTRARAQLVVFNTFMMFASSVGIIGLASYFAIKGSMSVGAVMGALGAFSPVFRMFNNLNGVVHEAQAAFAGADRVLDFLQQESEPDQLPMYQERPRRGVGGALTASIGTADGWADYFSDRA